MGFFARPDDLTRIDFDTGPLEGQWIMLRTRLSDAEIKRLNMAMVTGMALDDGGSVKNMTADTTEVDLHKMLAWVKKWSLTDDYGNQTHPTRGRLELLLPEYAAQILTAIDNHSAAQSAEDALAIDPLAESGSEPGTRSRTRARLASGTPSPEPHD